MRIAVDAMGGDHGCAVVVAGANLALQKTPEISQLFLVGRKEEIEPALQSSRHPLDPRFTVIHASEVLAMTDKPLDVIRKKRDYSMLRAVELAGSGRADAVISLGNTGGLLAAGTVLLRPAPHVERAAIAAVIPAPKNEFVLIDAGANAECKPLHLMQFAIMGNVYSREILGYKTPRVGILSNGSEAGKGTELTRDAFKLCQHLDLNFIGYVEGYDLFNNQVEVVVCDGFVGNIVLKTCESFGKGMMGWLKSELTQNVTRKFGALLARQAFRKIKNRMDPDNHGGAPLLGLNGNIIKAHGSAGERAIMNAIGKAVHTVRSGARQRIDREVQRAHDFLQRSGKDVSLGVS